MHDFEMLRGFGNGQIDRKNDICNSRVTFRAENAIFVPPSCLTVMSVIRNGHLNLNGEVQIRMGHLGSDLFGVRQEELLHICHPIYRWQIIGTIASFCTLLETEPLPCLYILTRLSV